MLTIKFGMTVKQREICLLPIPFSDLTSTKRRPVLVISNNDYNFKKEDILVMAITSNIQDLPTSILIQQSDMESGILKSDSQIRIDKIYSINKGLIVNLLAKSILKSLIV
jgi:mRNA-degrading endonuclease toxin of MazEF toxin-antitoxin module